MDLCCKWSPGCELAGAHTGQGGECATCQARNRTNGGSRQGRTSLIYAAQVGPSYRCCGLTDRASAAATCPFRHYLAFLRPKAPASCMRLLGGSGIVRQIEPHSEVPPIMPAAIPTTANMCATFTDETGIAGLSEPLPVLNCEIARQVANGEPPDVDANGIVIVGIRILQNQDGIDKLVCPVLCAAATDLLEGVLVRGLPDYLNEVVTGTLNKTLQDISAQLCPPPNGSRISFGAFRLGLKCAT